MLKQKFKLTDPSKDEQKKEIELILKSAQYLENLNCKIKNIELILQSPQIRGPFQKLVYAANRDADMVFFSKRRKNSSLCHHHTLRGYKLQRCFPFIYEPLSFPYALADL